VAVLNLGGSVICPSGPDVGYIQRLLAGLSDIRPLAIVVGGGSTARAYIGAGRELELNQFQLDLLGIAATRLNALLVAGAIPDGVFVEGVEEAAAVYGAAVPVLGGTEPGHTTDAVSLLLAEALGEEDVVIVTKVGGVYDRDPTSHPDARILEEVEAGALLREASEKGSTAGARYVLDPLSLIIAMRSGIRIRVIGPDPEDVRGALLGQEVGGTLVLPR